METVNGHIQVYTLWVNGRCKEDTNQHFPIDSNIEETHEWSSDFKKSSSDFLSCEAMKESEHGLYSDIYQDYHVALFSIDINIEKFENMFDLDFDIEDERVQEMIPYYNDYDFNTVCERISNF